MQFPQITSGRFPQPYNCRQTWRGTRKHDHDGMLLPPTRKCNPATQGVISRGFAADTTRPAQVPTSHHLQGGRRQCVNWINESEGWAERLTVCMVMTNTPNEGWALHFRSPPRWKHERLRRSRGLVMWVGCGRTTAIGEKP